MSKILAWLNGNMDKICHFCVCVVISLVFGAIIFHTTGWCNCINWWCLWINRSLYNWFYEGSIWRIYWWRYFWFKRFACWYSWWSCWGNSFNVIICVIKLIKKGWFKSHPFWFLISSVIIISFRQRIKSCLVFFWHYATLCLCCSWKINIRCFKLVRHKL